MTPQSSSIPDLRTDFAARRNNKPPKKKRPSPLSVRLSPEQRCLHLGALVACRANHHVLGRWTDGYGRDYHQ